MYTEHFKRFGIVTILSLAWAGSYVWHEVRGARILALETIPGKSRWNFMSAVLRALTDNGHNVTVFTPFPDGNRENYTEVDIYDMFPSKLVGLSLAELMHTFHSTYEGNRYFVDVARSICTSLHSSDRLTEVLTGTSFRDDFDAIVLEAIRTDCLTYLSAKSNLPLIFTVPTSVLLTREFGIFGDVSNPATVAPLMTDHAVPKTFAQRFSNVVSGSYRWAIFVFFERLRKTSDPKPFDAFTSVPPSLVFVNSHFITDAPRPIPDNLVQIGGIHLKPPRKIPDDINEFIEDSPHGVILFTFGSSVSMTSIPEDIQNLFITAIAQLPQRVLLKYEREMKDKPKNVMIKKWFPQRDILMHPKVVLFISHGGLSGVYEAVDAGVPVLGFPLFFDQFRNIGNLVEAGMAISMEILTVSNDVFLKNILELVNNEKYMKNAKIASEVFKDRPMSPENSVVYWTEYVIQHKGAPHLKSQGLNLTWYQYYLLDVIGVILVLLLTFSFIVIRVFNFIYMYAFKYSQHHIKKKSE